MQIRCLYDKLVPISELKPHPKNRNSHPEDQIVRLAKILKYQGWRYPVKVSKQSGFITSGHGRLAAAILNKWDAVPVNYQDYENEDQEYADLIADNSVASWAELELAKINLDLADLGPDFDLDMLGIKDFKLDPADKFHGDEDAVPETQKEPISKLGDLYELGDHRVLCGDSTKREDVDRLMSGQKADMVFTDPPYGIGLDYNSHDDSEEKWYGLINKIIPISKSIAPFVVMPCCRIKSLDWWYKFHKPDWIMCWYKGSPGHCSHVGFNDWEPHLVWGKPKNQMHDFWQTACGFEVDGHPCPKPVAYCQWILERAINQDDLMVDLFLGAGTSLIASEKTKRKCFGMEIDPVYVDVIVSRWCKFTGQTKIKRNGQEINWEPKIQ